MTTIYTSSSAVAATAEVSSPPNIESRKRDRYERMDKEKGKEQQEENEVKNHGRTNSNNKYQKRNNNNHNNHNNNRRKKRGRQQQQSCNGGLSQQTAPPVCSVCSISESDTVGKEEAGAAAAAAAAKTPKEPPKYKCPKCLALYCSVACCRKHKIGCPGKPPTQPPVPTSTTGINHQQGSYTRNDEVNGDVEDENIDDNHHDSDDDESSVEEGWKITEEMKVALRNSSWLHEELQDGGLRDLITNVVRSSKKLGKNNNNKKNFRTNQNKFSRYSQQETPAEILNGRKRENRNFDIFCDKLLVLAGVLERQGVVDDGGGTGNGTAAAAAAVKSVCAAAASSSSAGHSTNGPRNEHEIEEWLKQKWDPNGVPPAALALKPILRKPIPKFEPIDVSSSSSEGDDDDDDDDDDDEDEDEEDSLNKDDSEQKEDEESDDRDDDDDDDEEEIV
jgi:hypothetical protein